MWVIILNWNGWADTLECLESVYRLRRRAGVNVTDNASTNESVAEILAWAERRRATVRARDAGDGAEQTPELVVRTTLDAPADGHFAALPRHAFLLLETGANLGYAGGINAAIRFLAQRSDADYVWLLNNDTVVDPGALDALVAIAEADPAVGLVGSKLLHYDRPDTIQAAGGGTLVRWQARTRFFGEDELDEGQWDRRLEPEYVTGASILARVEAIREVGPLDESFFLYSEEVDWCLRMRDRGWRMGYAPRSVVWHKGGQSITYKSASHDYYAVRNALFLVARHAPAWLPVAFVYQLGRSLLPKIVRRQPARMRAVLRAFRDFLLGRRGP